MTPKRHLTPKEANHLNHHHLPLTPPNDPDLPIEYHTQHATFCGLDFLVTQDTLIPRIETEKIVDLALSHTASYPHPVIADIGTGSGCIGISISRTLKKQNHPHTIYLSDISLKALKVANLNATRLLPSPENVFFQISNLFSAYPPIKFDLITANLPYIPTPNLKKLPPSVINHEPLLALDGGPKGNLFINALLDTLPDKLNPGGLCILEIDDTHTQKSFSIPSNLIASVAKDVFLVDRFLLVRSPNLKQDIHRHKKSKSKTE